jgi:hypothetical protein
MATIIKTLELREAAVSAAEMVIATEAGAAQDYFVSKTGQLVREVARSIGVDFQQVLDVVMDEATANLIAKKVI